MKKSNITNSATILKKKVKVLGLDVHKETIVEETKKGGFRAKDAKLAKETERTAQTQPLKR